MHFLVDELIECIHRRLILVVILRSLEVRALARGVAYHFWITCDPGNPPDAFAGQLSRFWFVQPNSVRDPLRCFLRPSTSRPPKL